MMELIFVVIFYAIIIFSVIIALVVNIIDACIFGVIAIFVESIIYVLTMRIFIPIFTDTKRQHLSDIDVTHRVNEFKKHLIVTYQDKTYYLTEELWIPDILSKHIQDSFEYMIIEWEGEIRIFRAYFIYNMTFEIREAITPSYKYEVYNLISQEAYNKAIADSQGQLLYFK